MIQISFGYNAFNKACQESIIEMVMASKQAYDNGTQFLLDALNFFDEKVYPNEDYSQEYKGFCLKDGNYENIVKNWISQMDQSIEINFDDILRIQRIKLDKYNPLQDDFLIETKYEFIMFTWATSA